MQKEFILMPGLVKMGETTDKLGNRPEIIIPETIVGLYLEPASKLGKDFSALDYASFSPPTLAVCFYGFHGIKRGPYSIGGQVFSMDCNLPKKNRNSGKLDEDRDFSPEYRHNVTTNDGDGEFFNTFVEEREPSKGEVIKPGYRPVRVINKPNKIIREIKKEGEKETVLGFHMIGRDNAGIFNLQEPPNGSWITGVDYATGYPTAGSSKRGDSERVFGGGASRFFSSNAPFRAVYRRTELHKNNGPFCIYATAAPDEKVPGIEARWSKDYDSVEITLLGKHGIRIVPEGKMSPDVLAHKYGLGFSFELVPEEFSDGWLGEFIKAAEIDYYWTRD